MNCAGCKVRDRTIVLLERELERAHARELKFLPQPPFPVPPGPAMAVETQSQWLKDVDGREWGTTPEGTIDSRENIEGAYRMLDQHLNGRPPYPEDEGGRGGES